MPVSYTHLDVYKRQPYEQTHLKAMDDPYFNNYFHTFFRCIGDNDCFRSRFLEEDAIIQVYTRFDSFRTYEQFVKWLTQLCALSLIHISMMESSSSSSERF